MTWTFKSPLGSLQCGALAGQVDVSTPQLGVHQLRLQSAPLAGKIGCIAREAEADTSAADWPAKINDTYVRGSDLIATYRAGDDWPFAPQIYWRAESSDAGEHVLGSLSLLVSVSTHLLDTCPRISASSELTADEVLQVISHDEGGVHETSLTGCGEALLRPERGAGCLLRRLPGGEVSYAEIAPANDFRRLTVTHDKHGVCLAQWELFAEFLEKGVIRRARLLSVFLPRRRDVELAAACSQHFAARPLPLTT